MGVVMALKLEEMKEMKQNNFGIGVNQYEDGKGWGDETKLGNSDGNGYGCGVRGGNGGGWGNGGDGYGDGYPTIFGNGNGAGNEYDHGYGYGIKTGRDAVTWVQFENVELI